MLAPSKMEDTNSKMEDANSMDHQFITVVSGLPRSGTSMMMQVLEAGGIPPLTDHSRKSNEDNPAEPTVYVRTLFADPAFNPYEPNNGFSDQGRPEINW